MPDHDAAVEQAILALDDRWAEARVQQDIDTYDRLTADDFLGINANGGIVTKQGH